MELSLSTNAVMATVREKPNCKKQHLSWSVVLRLTAVTMLVMHSLMHAEGIRVQPKEVLLPQKRAMTATPMMFSSTSIGHKIANMHNASVEQDGSGTSDEQDGNDTSEGENYDDSITMEEPQTVPYQNYVKIDPTFRNKSPYEIRWPGHRQPDWNKKVEQSRQSPMIPGEGQQICYVHVGKTAGSTVGCALGFSLHCWHDSSEVSSLLPGTLPAYTTNLFHSDVNDCPDSMPNYLFIVRNPIHRIESAYVYDRVGEDYPDKALYVDCPFWTLKEFVMNGLAMQGNATEHCKRRAAKAILGRQFYADHLYHNYEYYWKSIDHEQAKSVLVIRTEHLVLDWNSAEMAVDPSSNFQVNDQDFATKNVGSKSKDDSKPLDSIARMLLCEALCRDIQFYKRILRSAVNLTPDDVKVSLLELRETCPIQASVDTCTF